MIKSLNVMIGELDSLEQALDLLRMATKAASPKTAEAIEKASFLGAKISVMVKNHQFVKHADVSEYNKAIAEAFPNQVEEKKKECDCSQKHKHKDKSDD